MNNILQIMEIIVAVLLITTILMQQTGTTLGGAFGGGESHAFRSRRGPERFLFQATIWLAVLFVGIAIVLLVGSAS